MRTRPRLALLAGAMAAALVACTAPPPKQQTDGALVIDMGFPGTTITRNFNPFSPNATQGTHGFLYETLFGFNILKAGEFVPWLVTEYEWSDAGRKITLHMDERATWSDGDKVTAKDVVFTLDYVRAKKAQPDWKFGYESASAPDPATVVITFAEPAYSLISSIGGIAPVPAKVWQEQDPHEFTNPSPVASGPYELQTYSAQQLTFAARKDYWRQRVPVKTLKMPVTAGGQGGQNRLLKGEIEWSGGSVADVKKVYVAKDPEHNHAWYPTYGGLFMYFNVEKAPFTDVHVRRGVSLAVGRKQIADIGNPGLFSPIGPTGLDAKTQGKWIAPKYKGLEQPRQELSKALAEFAKAGYTKKAGKLVGRDGRQLSFQIIENADFADSVQRDRVVADQLAKVGAAVEVRPVPQAQLDSAKKSGKFDVHIGGAIYYNTPYGFYNDMLNSEKAGLPYNYSRFKSKAIDRLLLTASRARTDAEVKAMSAELEEVVVDQVPVAPLITIGASIEYNTKNWAGWPDAKNPYAMSAPWAGSPDVQLTLLNLRPAK